MKPLGDLLGDSPAIQAIRESVERLLQRQHDAVRLPPVLIQGETGTGKGLLARLIHRAGPRSEAPFVDVNCAAIPETLLEAEMFGYERGAFTDARRAKPGLFSVAHRGTIFLDEVGLLSELLQAKLLKILEERTVRRLGGTRNEPVDVWVLTATNEDLRAAIRQRRFREDLYHRLAVLTLTLPPLRERRQDILPLAEHFLARACADYGGPRRTFTPEAHARLLGYPWPGNVREVSNVIERAVLMSGGPQVTAEMLGLQNAAEAEPPVIERGRDHLLEVLTQTSWNISRSALLLGISRNTLRARIQKYGLRAEAAPPTVLPDTKPRPVSPPMVPVDRPAVASTPAPTSLRWERRRVALLRATFVPPSGPDALLETSRALEVLMDKVVSFGGKIEGVSPTGVIAVFGLESTEDAASRAAHTAMAVLKAGERARRDSDMQVAVKLGVHVSHVLVGVASGASQLDLEARRTIWPYLDMLAERAAPNTILVSEAAAPFLRRRFELEPGPQTPETKERTYLFVGRERTGLGLGGRMVKFVGRHHELELLQDRLQSATRGRGQVVGIAGDAGLGKSRMIFEFRQSQAGQPGTYLEGHCYSYGTATPYLPVLDLLRASCGIGDSDTPEVIVDKVHAGLTTAGMDPREASPYLLQVLGVKEGVDSLAALSPEAIKTRVFETLRQMSLRQSRRNPLIIVLEDLHWIDSASEEYFASLAENLGGARILLVSTYRPGYRPPWMEKSYATQIALQPLGPEESMGVVHALLGPREVADPLVQLVLAKAEGNPFFIEELARAAGERGDLFPDVVPETIQDVLLARIERLSDDAKRLLQAAAIVGRGVPLQLLRAIWDEPDTLERLLRELARLEFVYGEDGAEEPVYVFKHALTQEVAYESLPAAHRQALHAAAAHALEALYSDRLEEACDRLAYHYARTTEDDKAIEYLSLAADKSARAYAHVQAVDALGQARARAERLREDQGRDRRVLDLVLREAHSLHVLGRFAEALDLLLRLEERMERLPDPALAGPYYFWLGRTYSVLHDRERTVPNVLRAAEHARASGDEATLGKAYFLLAFEDYWSGQPRHGVERGREAVALLGRGAERWWLGMAHWVVALNSTLLGEFEAGREAAARADASGQAIGDLRLQNYAAWTTGWIDATSGEWESGVNACEQSLQRSQDPVNTAYALGHLGSAYLEKGDPERAIPPLTQAIEQLGKFHPGFRTTRSRFMASLSEAYLATDRIDEAEQRAIESLTVSRDVKFTYVVGLAERTLGKIARARGDLSGAATQFEKALATFTGMQARFEVGQTYVVMAEFARAKQDDEGAARHLQEAGRIFEALHVPKHHERARRLASAWGIEL